MQICAYSRFARVYTWMRVLTSIRVLVAHGCVCVCICVLCVYLCLYKASCVGMLFLCGLFFVYTFFLVDSAHGCSPDLIKTVASLGFVSDMYNCIYPQLLGSEACLGNFNVLNNSIIPAGDCREVYQSLVDSWYSTIPSNCSQKALHFGAIPDNVECVLDGMSVSAFSAASRGVFPFTMCTGSQVRRYALAEAFRVIVGKKMSTRDVGWSSLTTPACNFCYESVFEPLIPDLAQLTQYGDNFLVYECTQAANNPTDACLNSSYLKEARLAFVNCAGYDILWDGNACTSQDITNVETLIPTPYYTFAKCAYFPDTPFCRTIQSYFAEILTNTGQDCVACYIELQQALEDYAAGDFAYVCETDVFATDCLAYNNQALMAFEKCAGKTINVTPNS